MEKKDELKSLSDDELLLRLSNVLKQSRRVEVVLVAHIAEVDAPGLFVSQASSSMHKYCTDVLHLSDAEAHLRIAAARASLRHPALLTMLEDGRLHLSGIALLAPYLTNSNCEELLARATKKTKGELLLLVAEIAPKADVAPSIWKLPERPRKREQEPAKKNSLESANEHRASGAEATPSGKSNPIDETRPAEKPPIIEPLAPSRYRVQFTASPELHDKLERLGKVKKPRKTLEEADTSPGVRGISAPVRRFVWERDQGQCTYESTDGRRCPERRGLQFHHDDPYWMGGDRGATNVRLMCAAHNLYMGEMDYGKDKMNRHVIAR